MSTAGTIAIFVAFVVVTTLSACALMLVSEYSTFHMGRKKKKR